MPFNLYKIKKKKLDGFMEIIPKAHTDKRGFLVRLYDKEIFQKFGINAKWVQESHSHTSKKHTLRGLHVQLPPFSEEKLIRAINGKILWVAVDLRKNSKTFGKWDYVVLSGQLKNIIYVSRGFAHGCLSLSDNCDLVIKSDNYFSQNHSTGIIWNDKDLNIEWGLKRKVPLISKRDKNYLTFKEFKQKYGAIKTWKINRI